MGVRILAFQPHIPRTRSPDERRAHVGALVHRLESASHRLGPVDLLVLPELTTVEYSIPSFDRLETLAEPLFGESFDAMATLSRRLGCAICFGMPREEDGHYFITQVVVGPDGQYLTHYDKIHLAQFGACSEKAYFTRGRRLGFFELGGVRLGIVICYDFRFPELIRRLVDSCGIDAVIHPVAFTRDGTYESWPHFVVCRALENQVYFLSVNRAGDHWGGSIFCPPWVDGQSDRITLGTEEVARSFDVEQETVAQVRANYPFRADRLPDYGALRPD